MNVLRIGSKGDAVKRLQLLLRSALVPPRHVDVDGDFGAKTEAAVIQFQKQRSLKPDGVVGAQTWSALGQKAHTSSSAAAPVAANLAVAEPAKAKPAPACGDWMEIAKAELDVSENHLRGQHNQRIVEYHQTTTLKATTDETPWCSSFVNWVIIQSGRKGTNNALARSWLDWGTASADPVYGAVVVVKKKNASSDAFTGSSTGFHVGFLVSKAQDTVRILGGNQADMVKYSNFKLAGYDVRGYRLP